MPQQLDIERDPFLILLTDALRAGPGSPQWHEAVAQLKTSDEKVDEYKLLIEAREALESGKDYRSVRAGAGFTRKLLGDLDRQKPGGENRIHTASLIALLAGTIVVLLIGVAVYELFPRPPADNTAKAIEELASTYLPNERSSSTFDNGIPSMWRKIGSLPLDSSDGLKAGAAAVPQGGYVGGGIVIAEPVQAAQPVALQVSLRVNQSGPDLIPQVFVSSDPEFSADRAISSQELVWQLQGDVQKVVVDGRVTHQAPINAKSPTHTVRLTVRGDLAIVESDGHRLWSGHSALGDKPRYLGVRFIRTGEKTTGDLSIQSVRVLTTNG